jgi:hypothetical protein
VFSFLFGSKLVRQVPGETGAFKAHGLPKSSRLAQTYSWKSATHRRGSREEGRLAHRAADHPSPSVDHRVLADQRSHVAILSARPPSPRHRGVCVRCSQSRGNDTARAWLSQRGLVGAVRGDPWTAERVPRNGYGSHGDSSLLSQRSRSVLREQWLRCSDTVRGFRPGHVPPCVPDITARFAPSGAGCHASWYLFR